jgi:hypothetical protein
MAARLNPKAEVDCSAVRPECPTSRFGLKNIRMDHAEGISTDDVLAEARRMLPEALGKRDRPGRIGWRLANQTPQRQGWFRRDAETCGRDARAPRHGMHFPAGFERAAEGRWRAWQTVKPTTERADAGSLRKKTPEEIAELD